jgi:hypothetical protein
MLIPLLVPSNAGAFAKALTLVSPGKNLLAFGDPLTWEEYVEMWESCYGRKGELCEEDRGGT